MDRKKFLKTSCHACLAISAGWMLTELAACAHLPIYKTEVANNSLSMPLSLFATESLQMVQAKGLEYDIAVRKEKDNTYTALLMKCTHADNQLLSTGNGFSCNLHGSAFDKEGTVTQGPAEQALKRYRTQVLNDNLIITIN
jgi:Rieske Fe-S protein